MKTQTLSVPALTFAAILLCGAGLAGAEPLGTAITYQGQLKEAGAPATGRYDLQFTLYDAPSGGTQVGPRLSTNAVAVSEGLFTVSLDFGAGVFTGNGRWLELSVRTNGGGAFTTLVPRQAVQPAPYALYALTPAGPQGPKGDAGATGAQGAEGPQGERGLMWRGLWNASSNYVADDAVQSNGSAWLAKRSNNNVTPTESSDWGLLAQEGDTGPQGVQGVQGLQGVQGATGPQGIQGLAGATGAQGPKGDTGATGGQGPQGLPGPNTTTDNTLYIGSDQKGSQAGSSLVLGTDNQPILTLLEGGFVGIGTNQPGAQLDVAGNAQFADDLRIGYVSNGEVASPGYGKRLYFSGAPNLWSGLDSENTDPLWMARYNADTNLSELRLNIGDDYGGGSTNADSFVVGVTDSHDQTWKPLFSVSSGGSVGFGTTNQAATVEVAGTVSAGTVQVGGLVLTNSGGALWVNGQSLAAASRSWSLGGNAGTSPADFLGKMDNNPLVLVANGKPSLRLAPYQGNDSVGAWDSVNVLAGYWSNSVSGAGATVGGGGGFVVRPVLGPHAYINKAQGSLATVAGGGDNFAGSFGATIGGGLSNFSNAEGSTIAGGKDNSTGGSTSTIGGGDNNVIQTSAYRSTIGGGGFNLIKTTAYNSTIGGGFNNLIQTNASSSTIGGGEHNFIQTDADNSTVGGGSGNIIQTNASYSTIGGGKYNLVQANATYATIGGGDGNVIQTNAYNSTIGGGTNNIIQINAYNSTIGGGVNNLIQTNAHYSTIGGGGGNLIQANTTFSTIGGGCQNIIQTNAGGATIGGGDGNVIQTKAGESTISGGVGNVIQTNAAYSTIGGGYANTIQTNAYDSTIGGGNANIIQTNAYRSTIGGGYYNVIQTNAFYSTIGGGYHNTIQTDADQSTIGGGYDNIIQTNASYSTIGGGNYNLVQANATYATIGGGDGNVIQTNAWSSTIGGGLDNIIQINAAYSTIGGGYGNVIQTNAFYSSIGGGYGNIIQTNAYRSTIGGGYHNVIYTNAYYSTIGGGYSNTVSGAYGNIPGGALNSATNLAFAAGLRAHAIHAGSFVWGDSSTTEDISSTSANSVTFRAAGGYRLFSNSGATAGASLAAGSGSWTSMSDRNAKENYQPVDRLEVLEKVVALPVTSWNYKSQDPSVRHLGPTAQDFRAAFGLGETELGITSVDADGVTLAAIQGLNQKLTEQLKAKEAQISALAQDVRELKALVRSLAGQRKGGGQ